MGEDGSEKGEKKSLTEATNAFLSNWGESLLRAGFTVGFGGGIAEMTHLSLKYLGEGHPDQAAFAGALTAIATLALIGAHRYDINQSNKKK